MGPRAPSPSPQPPAPAPNQQLWLLSAAPSPSPQPAAPSPQPILCTRPNHSVFKKLCRSWGFNRLHWHRGSCTGATNRALAYPPGVLNPIHGHRCSAQRHPRSAHVGLPLIGRGLEPYAEASKIRSTVQGTPCGTRRKGGMDNGTWPRTASRQQHVDQNSVSLLNSGAAATFPPLGRVRAWMSRRMGSAHSWPTLSAY